MAARRQWPLGLTSFDLGTDIAGSVRIPSSFCGVYGHKPSFGLVSQRGYLDRVGGGTFDADLNVFGPIARDAKDLDQLVNVLMGPDAEMAGAWTVRLPEARRQTLSDYRIGTWLDDPAGSVDAEVGDVLVGAVDALASDGAMVDHGRPPIELGLTFALFIRMVQAAVARSADGEAVEVLGGSHASWLADCDSRARIRAVWSEWFKDHDALLCPVMPMAAFPHDHHGPLPERTVLINGEPRSHLDTITWTGLIGLAGLPPTVVPVGRTPGGLPVGMQVVGPYLEDRTCLNLAARVSEVLGGYQQPPGY